MKVLVRASELESAVVVAARCVSRDRAFPILGTVQLVASPDGGLTLVGTDARTRGWRTVEADVAQAGHIGVLPQALTDFLAAVPADGEIAVESHASRVTMSCGRTVVRLAGYDPDGFPGVPSFEDPSAEAVLEASALLDLIRSVAFSALTSETSRPVLSGVALAAVGETLTAECADGFRLAKRVVDLGAPAELHVVVPAARVLLIERDLVKATGDVHLAVDARGGQLLIDSDAGAWTLSLIDAAPIATAGLYARVPLTVATLDRDELLRAVRLARNITTLVTVEDNKPARAVKSVLEIDSDSLTLRSGDEGGDHEAEAVVSAEVSGPPIRMGINGGYLRDAVEAVRDASVTLECGGPLEPITIRPAGTDDRRQLYLVMAMRLDGPDA